MTRSAFALAVVSILAAACSATDRSQSAPTGQETAAGSAAVDAARPETDRPAGSSARTDAAPAAAATPAPAAPATPAPSAAATPAPPLAPQSRELTIPKGTVLNVTLATTVASDTSKVEDTVRGTLAKPVVVSGTTVVPAGAEVVGSVLEANQSGRVKGRASIAFRFDRLRVGNESHSIQTARIAREAATNRGKDAKNIGIGAAAGAIIGGVAGGGDAAAIGAAVGGTGAALVTKGDEIRLPAGTAVSTTLQDSVTLVVPLQ